MLLFYTIEYFGGYRDRMCNELILLINRTLVNLTSALTPNDNLISQFVQLFFLLFNFKFSIDVDIYFVLKSLHTKEKPSLMCMFV